jgi:hypothetical protein
MVQAGRSVLSAFFTLRCSIYIILLYNGMFFMTINYLAWILPQFFSFQDKQ